MTKILEPVTSLEQELELRIEWLENGLKEIANGRDDMNGIYIKQQAQAILDGEPTTADEYNDEEDVQLGASIVKSNDEVSGVFMSDGKIEQIDYEYNDVISQYEDHEIQSEIKKVQSEIKDSLSPENTVRISDINKEIAVDWKNREREEKISMAKSIGHKGDE